VRNGRLRLFATAFVVSLVVATVAGGSAAVAGNEPNGGASALAVQLSGFQEDPQVVSTAGKGFFLARIDVRKQEITYRLSYSGVEGTVSQAHIHLGGAHQSGGISVFLCSNLGNGPAGTQACPPAPATITGTIRPADVIGPVGQGLAPQEFGELTAAIRAGATYVNVHTSLWPAGEIRGQLGDDHHH
jgi:CHRD domain